MKVYEALLASRFLPNVACAAPYHLSKTKIEFSRLGQIWPFVCSSIVVALLWLSRDKLPMNVDQVKGVLETLSFWMQFILAVFSVLKDGLCQRAMIDVARSIEDYDEKSGYGEQLPAVRENKNIRFWSFVYSFALLAFAAGRTANLLLFTAPHAIRAPFINLANEIVVMLIDNSICMFAVFATLVGMRFRHLNSLIELDRGIVEVGSSRSNASNPEYIRSLYGVLVGTGEKLNDIYSSRLFLWSARMVLETVTRVNSLTSAGEVSVKSWTRLSTRLLPFAVGMFVFTISCQFTIDQANRVPTVLLAKNIRLTARIDRGRKEIFTMSLYMALRPFAFSALGFFNVDLTLTYAAFTVTVTYIALCIQSHSS